MAKLNGQLWMNRIVKVVERDPEIERFRKIFNAEPLQRNSELAVLAGLSGSTVNNMFNGKTRRPQHLTYAKMAGAMGFEYGLSRTETPDYEAALVDARREFKEYKAHLKKQRDTAKRKRK